MTETRTRSRAASQAVGPSLTGGSTPAALRMAPDGSFAPDRRDR